MDNGQLLCKCQLHSCTRIWDVRTSKVASTTKLKKSAFLFLAWNPASPNILAAVQQNSETFFVDVQKQRVFKTLPSTVQVVICCKQLPCLARDSSACRLKFFEMCNIYSNLTIESRQSMALM